MSSQILYRVTFFFQKLSRTQNELEYLNLYHQKKTSYKPFQTIMVSSFLVFFIIIIIICFSFIFSKVQVVVKDGGIPALSSSGTLEITVIRNFFEPNFLSYQRVINVNDVQTPDVPFYQLKAIDRDTTVCLSQFFFSLQCF